MKGKDLLSKNRFVGTPWNKGLKFPDKSGPQSASWAGGEIKKICMECESEYSVKRYREPISKFCSSLCRQKNLDQGKAPISKRIRYSQPYKDWRKKVFERDLYTCQICNVRNGLGKAIVLNADHIKPFAYFPDLRFELENGRTLCVSCHKKTPTYGVGAWRKQLIHSAQEA